MTPPAAVEGLFGRDREVAALRGAIARIGSGVGDVVAIEGEAGSGKTSLLQVAVRAADAEGLASAVVTCEPNVASARLETVERLIGEVVSDRGDWLEEEWAVARLQSLAAPAPCVVVVDDAQFADDASLRALTALARSVRTIPLLLIVAFRPAVAAPSIDRLAKAIARAGTLLNLAPLSPADVDSFVEHLAGERPSEELAAGVAAARGNPFFIEAFVRDALSGRKAPPGAAGRGWLILGTTAPDDETANMLGIGSVLGTSFSVVDMTELAAVPTAHLLPKVSAALASGVLIEDGNALRFSHQLVRDAFYDKLPRAIRVGLHRDAANILRQRGAPAVDVARHLLLAEATDAGAIATLREGVRDARRGGSPAALEIIRRALDACPPTHPEREELLVDVVQALAWAGRVDEARALALRELDAVSDPTRAELEAGLANVLLTRGRGAEAVTHLLSARRRVLDDPGARVRIDAELGAAQLSAGNFDEAQEAARTACDAPEADVESRVLGHTTLAFLGLMHADLAAAQDEAREAVRLATIGDVAVQRRVPGLSLGIALVESDQTAEAIAVLRASARDGAAAGAAVTLPQHHWVLALGQMRTGAWDDAIAEATTGLEIAYDLDHAIGVAVAHTVLAEIALARGELATFDAAVADAERAMLTATDWFGLDRLLWLKARRLDAEDPVGALEGIRNAWQLGDALRIHLWRPWFALDLVRLELTAGERAHAAQAASELRAIAQRSRVRSHALIAELCAAAAGDDFAAGATAVERFAQLRLLPTTAQAEAMVGDIAARIGDNAAAMVWFSRSYDTYAELDARASMRTIEARIVQLGGDRRARSEAVYGWGALTDKERLVTNLVAKGLANTEIAEELGISRRTVENHLYRIFPKLGIASRVQLALYADNNAR